ncbi:MAG: hypothetical protein AABZ47_14345 [Planctomycetota bacterium]
MILVAVCLSIIQIGALPGDELPTVMGSPTVRYEEVKAEIRAVFENAATSKGPSAWNESCSRLERLPKDILVRALVAEIAQDGEPPNSRIRILAYTVLSRIGAANDPAVFDLFVEGMSDPSLSAICFDGLVKAPPDRHAEVVERLIPLVTDNTLQSATRISLVRSIGRIGPSAGEAVEILLKLYRNDQEADSGLRAAAAASLLRIVELERALELLRDTKPPLTKHVVGSFGTFIGETDERLQYDLPDEYCNARAKVRQYVIEKLFDDDREVRETAVQVLNWSFSADWVIFHTEDKYEWEPVLRAAMERIATQDPDEVLRGQAREAIERFPQRVEATLRRRQSAAEKKANDPSKK